MKLPAVSAAILALALTGCAAEAPSPAVTPAGVTDDFRGVSLESAVTQFDEANVKYQVKAIGLEGVTDLQNPKDPSEQGKWKIVDLTDKDDHRIFAKNLNVGDFAVILVEPWEGVTFPEGYTGPTTTPTSP